MVTNIRKSDILIGLAVLVVLSVVVHGWILLNTSFFWDDWIWVTHPQELKTAMDEMGVVFFKSFYYSLYSDPNAVFLIKLLIFSSYLFGSCLFYLALSMLSNDKNKNLLITGVLFVVLPYNILGRSLLCTSGYTVSFFMFCLSYFGYVRFRLTNQWFFLFLAFVGATFSFNAASFLVLYPVMFALTEAVLLSPEKLHIRRGVICFLTCLTHSIVFFVMKKYYFPVQEYYAGYNQVSFSAKTFFDLFFNKGPVSFLRPLVFSFFGQNFTVFLTKATGFFLVIIFYWPFIQAWRKKNFVALRYTFVGITLILAAVFPYLVAGKSPNSFSWDARHELLLPFGAVFWFFGAMSLYAHEKYKSLIWTLLIVSFSFGSARLYMSLQGLHFQQKALVAGLDANIELENSGAYLFVDKILPPGVMRAQWHFYQLSGIINRQTDTQKHAIIEERQIENFENSEKRARFFTKRYMLSNAKWEPPFYCLTMSGKERISEWEALKLLTKEIFTSQEEVLKEVSGYYNFTKTPAPVVNSRPECPI